MAAKIDMLLHFADIAHQAGFKRLENGILQIPSTDEAAKQLALAAYTLVSARVPPNDDKPHITLTLIGPGPIWGYIAITTKLTCLVDCIQFGLPHDHKLTLWSRTG
jgi:hypothetical protein